MDIDLAPQPHEEAARAIEGRKVVSRDVFYGLLPELRARAFTISGVEGANVMQRVRDSIATLARGTREDGEAATWDTQKKEIVQELEPFLGDGAEQRATVLLRTHGFQAFQAANWEVAQEDVDTTHIQYLATEDDRVRDSHLALNGIVLPKDDPFWDTHMPPWEWGCRCRIRAMNEDLVELEREADQKRNPEDRNVVEGPVLDSLRNGTIMREGRRFDVTPPRDKRTEAAPFEWHPDDLRLPVGELQMRYDPEVWTTFESWARKTLAQKGTTVWNWLLSKPAPRTTRMQRARLDRMTIERAKIRDGAYTDS